MRKSPLSAALFASACLIFASISIFTPVAAAQGKKVLNDKPYVDKKWGYQVTALEKWNLIPPDPREPYRLLKFESPSDIIEPKLLVRHTPDLKIYRFDPSGKSAALLDQAEGKNSGDGPKTGDEGGPNLKELQEQLAYKNFDQWFAKQDGFQMVGKPEKKKVGKNEALVYNFKRRGSTKLLVQDTAYVFTSKERAQYVLIYEVFEYKFDEWKSVFEESAKSFNFVDRVELDPNKLNAMTPLERDEALHREDCERTGWKFAKSKHYFIKYNIDKKEFIDEIKERIEAIRSVFVKDYGDKELTQYPVLRVCKSIDEYYSYGAPGGSGGYFSSSSKELVVPAVKEIDIKITWVAMNHEAFHQFIWFRFGEVSPHSWYNEGTGDYYGGFRYQGPPAKFKIETLGTWATVLDRVSIIKDALKRNVTIPMDKIFRFSQAEYYNGPSTGGDYSHGLLCYSQGWSMIYFLRQAKALGHTPYKKEWDSILPTYFDVLAKTQDLDKAIETALKDLKGPAMEEFENSWKEFVRKLN